MTIEQIIALTQAGFSKYDILEMVSQNQMQMLRDELSTTRAALSNNIQTQNILGALQPTPRPAYVTSSPYAATNYCGCGV